MKNSSGRVWLRTAVVIASLATGFAIGHVTGGRSDVAQAEVRETTPRAAFQAGAERSEATLREMTSILKRMESRLERMDGRIERMEKVATDFMVTSSKKKQASE